MHMLEQHQGKDHVSAQDQADENMAGSGSGVYLAEYKGEYMEVSMESANQLTVSAGALWVNGRFCIVDPAETLTVDNGSSGMTEYDLVCVHWKETTATQQVALAEGGTKEVSTTVEETELVIVKGDPASSGATDPEISQTTIRAGVGEAWVPFARITKDGLTPSVAFIVDKLVPESKFRTSIAPNVLWQGSLHMSGSQQANLSSNLNEQMIGIYLCWKEYTDGVATENRTYQFIPKGVPSGCAFDQFLTNRGAGLIGNKQVYVYDDRIVGDDNNSKGEYTASTTNLRMSNNRWVLAEIIGI